MDWNGCFSSDDHYVYFCGQEYLRRNGVALGVSKSPNAVLWFSLKNDRMISVHLPGKPFNITVIQVYALTTNNEEAEVEWIYQDLQDLSEVTYKKKKKCPFHYRGLECKSKKSRDTWSNRQILPWSTKLKQSKV